MDLYTLDENFLRRDAIDNFTSVVWTERYTKAGDVNLLVPPTRENIVKLPEGTFLALQGSKEVMQIENALIEGGKLKLTGPTITQFLDNRAIRYSANHADRYYNITMSPGVAMGFLVNDMVVAGSPYTTSSAYGVDGPRQVIPRPASGKHGFIRSRGGIGRAVWAAVHRSAAAGRDLPGRLSDVSREFVSGGIFPPIRDIQGS